MADDEFDDQEAGVDIPAFLRDPMGIFGRRWLWILLGLLLGLGATSAAVLYTIPIYQARATILVSSQQIPEEFVRSTVQEDPFSRLGAMVGLVLSRQKLLGMIDEFGLYTELRERQTMDEVVGIMRSAIIVTPQDAVRGGKGFRGDTARMFDVSYSNTNPQLAAAVTNRLAALFIEGGLQSRMDHAIGISNFMRDELDRTDLALRQVEREIAEFKEINRGRLPEDLESNLRRLERLQEQRSSLAIQLAEAETRVAMISSEPAPVATEEDESPQARLERLQNRYELELAVHTPRHPSAIALKRQIEQLEALVAATPPEEKSSKPSQHDVLLSSARKRIVVLQGELTKTNNTIAGVEELVNNTSKTRENLTALEERGTVLRAKYNEFLNKVSEAEMAKTLEAAQYGARVTIIDRANAPTNPKNGRKKIAILGLIATFGLAVMLGLLFEFFDPVVVDRSQLESMTGLPVLGSVPKLS